MFPLPLNIKNSKFLDNTKLVETSLSLYLNKTGIYFPSHKFPLNLNSWTFKVADE